MGLPTASRNIGLVLTALVLILAAAAPATGLSCVEPPEGLVGWWPGDEDASDWAGDNDGTLEGYATLAPAVVEQGFALAGGDDAVRVEPDPAFDFGAGSFSIHTWVYLEEMSPSGYNLVAGQRVEEGEYPGWVLLRSGGRWRLRAADEDGVGDQYDVFSNEPVVLNEWTHLVVVADRASNLLTMYVNGQAQSSPEDITGLGAVSNTAPLWIGRADQRVGFEWVGLIDEVALFNRALSADEVANLFAAPRGICRGDVEEVQIDIRPGSPDNPINPRARGVLPVAILSNEYFDATEVDVRSLELAGANVATRGRGEKPMAHAEDVDEDGVLDLLVKFDLLSMDLSFITDGLAYLTGMTIDGREILGADTVKITDTKRDKGPRQGQHKKGKK